MKNVERVRLTQTVKKGGCAAKIAARELRDILSGVEFPPRHPNIIIDGSSFDDAAVWKVADDKAIVQTLDFFTPIVDTPRVFGKVAAANAISDVYAMGGTPRTALAILAFPLAELSNEVIVEVLQGASEVMRRAGVSFVGGHSIDDDTLKFGLSVTGEVHPDRIWSNRGVQDGQVLVLTKPLGTGTLAAALKRDELSEADIQDALDSMAEPSALLDLLDETERREITAATDVTGFGLLGHALNMALASDVDLEVKIQQVPRFSNVEKMLEAGFLTKAHRSNRNYVQENLQWPTLSEIERLILLDPQTSGGLLLSMSEAASERVLPKIRSRFKSAAVIGRATKKSGSSPSGPTIRCT